MFLRATVRKKDGKEHTYFSVVENKRVADGRVVQRHVLYFGGDQQYAGACLAQVDRSARRGAEGAAHARAVSRGSLRGCGGRRDGRTATARAAAAGAAAAVGRVLAGATAVAATRAR